MEKTFHYFSKHIGWMIVAVIFLYPFYYPLIFELPRFSWDKLYTFGLPHNEFMTVWVALGGIIVIVANIVLTNKRISDQDEQIHIQLQLIQIQQKQQNDQLYSWKEQDQLQKKAYAEQRHQFEAKIQKQNEQIEIQQKQIEIQQKQLLDNCFSSGVKLLGNQNESIRMGGAYTLYYLAKDSEEYRKCVCEILCGHIRSMTNKKEYKKKYEKKPSIEIQTIFNLLFQNEYGLIFDEYHKNLAGVTLNGVNFSETVMSDVSFVEAVLNDVVFDKATCDKVDFLRAKLSNIKFGHASLRNLNFWYTSLSNVDFSDAKFVRQSINFRETILEHVPYEKITEPGRSLELTRLDDDEDDDT